MKHAIKFHLPVYKDQTVADDLGLKVEVGDTVTLVIDNDTAGQTTQDVVATRVFADHKGIEWDAGTTGNLRPDDIVRVHRKHQYNCPGSADWQIVLTEAANADSVAGSVDSITLNGIEYDLGVTEDAAADGIEADFAQKLVDAINQLIGVLGYADAVVAGVAGAQTLTLTIRGLTVTPSDIAVTAFTAGAWAEV